jgi:hypothetical protein
MGGDAGVLVHVVGWNGPVRGDRALLDALRGAGCPQAMETFDWTGGHRSLTALWRAQHSAEPAAQLADRIASLWRERPGRPIDLTADSSGCGVALAAVASLPPEVRVRTLVLSSPAVSPAYDLRPAFRHVDREIVSFHSDRDWLILWLGTTVFGTADGRHTPAAGWVGFVVPPDASEYAKLHQIPYDPAWRERFGNTGGHARALSPRFAETMIAPLFMD